MDFMQAYTMNMKNSGTYKNGQIVSEVKNDTLTHYFITGDIKAQGPYKNGQFQGKWIFNKKEGCLWQVGHFRDNLKHGSWVRYKPDGSVEKEQEFVNGEEVK